MLFCTHVGNIVNIMFPTSTSVVLYVVLLVSLIGVTFGGSKPANRTSKRNEERKFVSKSVIVQSNSNSTSSIKDISTSQTISVKKSNKTESSLSPASDKKSTGSNSTTETRIVTNKTIQGNQTNHSITSKSTSKQGKTTSKLVESGNATTANGGNVRKLKSGNKNKMAKGNETSLPTTSAKPSNEETMTTVGAETSTSEPSSTQNGTEATISTTVFPTIEPLLNETFQSTQASSSTESTIVTSTEIASFKTGSTTISGSPNMLYMEITSTTTTSVTNGGTTTVTVPAGSLEITSTSEPQTLGVPVTTTLLSLSCKACEKANDSAKLEVTTSTQLPTDVESTTATVKSENPESGHIASPSTIVEQTTYPPIGSEETLKKSPNMMQAGRTLSLDKPQEPKQKIPPSLSTKMEKLKSAAATETRQVDESDTLEKTSGQCVATAPRLNLHLDKMLGEWYPAKLSQTTLKLWGQSFKKDHKIKNVGCLLMNYSMPPAEDGSDDQNVLVMTLRSSNESTSMEAIFVGDAHHPKESKWAISWPNGEDTLTSVVAAGLIGKEETHRYTWLLTVDCDLNGIVEPDWAVMARVPEGISNSTLTTILAIVEGLKGLAVENAITYQSDDCGHA